MPPQPHLQQQPPNQTQHLKAEQKKNHQNAQIYHINLDQSPQSSQSQQQQQQQQMVQQQQQHKVHVQSQQGPPPDRSYHMEMKHDDRKDGRGPVQGHIPEGMVYISPRPGIPPIHPNVMIMPPNQQQVVKLKNYFEKHKSFFMYIFHITES